MLKKYKLRAYLLRFEIQRANYYNSYNSGRKYEIYPFFCHFYNPTTFKNGGRTFLSSAFKVGLASQFQIIVFYFNS